MPFENFPHTEQAQQPAAPVKKESWRNYLTGFLIIALLGTWGYIIWDKNRIRETIQQKDTVISTTSTQRDELQKELEDATMRYDMIKTSSANMMHSKDSVITKRDRDIAKKRDEIRNLLATAQGDKKILAEVQVKIAALNSDIENYKSSIEKLQGEKIVLTQEKENVTRQKEKVIKDLDSTQTVLKQSEEIINIGSTMLASNFSITGINEKSSGKEKITSTAKRVNKLRISFDLEENRIAQTGKKDIYICITAPDGSFIESGNKFNIRDGSEKFYTQKIEVNYTQGQRQNVSFDWKQGKSFQTGDYKIEIYNNGFKIGEGVRPLKKGGLFG